MRVIAGTWGGRRLQPPDGSGVRPTTDRVKEAMFASLHFYLPDAVVLDMFGGCGALGIEAASRGAKEVVIIEESSRARRTIHENLKRLGSPPQVRVVAGSYEQVCRQLEGSVVFDIALLDPPYRSGVYEDALRTLLERNLVHAGTRAVLESDHEPSVDLAGFEIRRRKTFGSVRLLFGEFTE